MTLGQLKSLNQQDNHICVYEATTGYRLENTTHNGQDGYSVYGRWWSEEELDTATVASLSARLSYDSPRWPELVVYVRWDLYDKFQMLKEDE